MTEAVADTTAAAAERISSFSSIGFIVSVCAAAAEARAEADAATMAEADAEVAAEVSEGAGGAADLVDLGVGFMIPVLSFTGTIVFFGVGFVSFIRCEDIGFGTGKRGGGGSLFDPFWE